MAAQLSDERLLALIAAGDARGLSGLYDRHGSGCLEGVAGLVETRADAEDLVFEVFLMMWREPPPAGVSVQHFLLASILDKMQALRH
jgi:DNA-directed RNA polymerase specialized sigma24 family protein